MANIKQEKVEPQPMDDRAFEIICQYQDTCSSNLNERFDSYGCSTLEAKVPVVNDSTVEKLFEVDDEQQLYATLAFKSKSATEAIQGRAPRTRNRVLKMVEINNEIILSAGKTREESPVDPQVLDDELEQYMKERALLKARQNNTSTISDDAGFSLEEMDDDLAEYMKEAARKKNQKKNLIEQSHRFDVMNAMEEDFDLDRDMGDM